MNARTASDAIATLHAAREALAKGDVAGAERLCMALVQKTPAHAGAWALLAETALLRDRADAAIVCSERAIALAPGDPVAHIMQAKTRLQMGDLSEALAAAEAAAPLIGAAPDAADALAALFGLLGRHEHALELSRRAVAARPDNPQYLFNLAATLRILGELEEAQSHCDTAIAHDPRFALAYYVRADLRAQSVERNHIGEMEALLARGGLDWRAETLLRYALAKECEDVEEDQRAFAHAATGARLWRSHHRYDARAEMATIDRIIATQTKSWLKAVASARGASDAAPIFVCGLPRSGTTLVERLIASQSAASSVGETNVFAIEAGRGLRGSLGSAPDFAVVGERYIRAVQDVFAPRSARFVDKSLTNYLCCGMIRAALPRAKIILVERDAMDCAWSIYKAHFRSGFLFSYDLVELADYFLAYRRLVEHWRATLPAEAVIAVAYEDVVRATRRTAETILAFLDLPWEEAALRFHESRAPSATASAVQVRRPIYASSIERWRRHEAALAPFRERLAWSGRRNI